jgi:hypothetical protein
MSTRDEIIADWRNRLAEATVAPTEPSSRPAWLIRLRVRLYQFLLSLYGEGHWHSADVQSSEGAQQVTDNQTAESIAWQGKPAKDITAIRAVLSSVAEARPSPNVPGSFAEGAGPEAWIVVATFNTGIQPQRCTTLLNAKKISARWLSRNDDVTVEVRSKDEAQATHIIQANINRLRRFNRFVVPSRPLFGAYLSAAAYRFTLWLDKRSFTLITIFHFSLVIPLAYLWAGIMSTVKTEYNDLNLRDDIFHDSFWNSLRGMLILAFVLTWLRLHWRARGRQTTQPARPSGID